MQRGLGVMGVALAGLVLYAGPASADKLYKWVDPQGNVTYQDQPPPKGVTYTEQIITEPATGESSMAAAAASHPITLYATTDCDSCDLVRNYLDRYSIPFVEKDAGHDVAVQQELKKRAGRLQVPTLLIGDKPLTGYSRTALDTELAAAGYPLDGAGTPPAAAGGTAAKAADISPDQPAPAGSTAE